MKVVERVLEKWIRRTENVDEIQFSFMPERGTIDAVIHAEKNAKRESL